MIKINVVMDFIVGGAYIGLLSIAHKLPQYQWTFTTEVQPDADIVLYMNNNRHYEKAKKLGIKYIIQRKTGERSLKVITPDDLVSVICGSKKSFEHTKHPRKVLIYNGVDFDHIKIIKPKQNIQLLCSENRIGTGQRIHLACEYAIKHNKKLTILGSGEGVAEDTYAKLRKKYTQFNWIGRVEPDEALAYIKACEAIIVSNPSHGCANQILEAVSMDKPIITLANLEIPNKADIDINVTAKKYDELIRSILK
mgnify:CR=1 FL=1